MWDYTDKVREHFFNPRNVGKIEDYDGIGTVGSIACGDALTLTFKLDEKKETIVDAKFQTFGCASAIASSSALTEILKGMSLEDAAKVTNQDIADYLGGLPEQKMHCSVMGREALEAAVEHFKSGGKPATEKVESAPVICVCFGVAQDEIERAIIENGLTTIEQVTNFTKAGGGCGGCHTDIQMILDNTISASRQGGKQVKKRELTNLQRIKLIEETIETDIRPMLRNDGGDIELIDVDGTHVKVALRGNCSGCNVAHITLRDVVEARLREYVDETITVEEEK